MLYALALVPPAFARDFQWVGDEAIENAKKALVSVQVEATTAVFGFFASEQGLIVTPASPLENAQQVVVTTSDNVIISDCRLMAIDLENNVAVLATGRKPPGHVSVSVKPAAVGEECAVVFGFTPGEEAKAADGKLLARHEGLNNKGRGFTDFWFVARSPSATGVFGGVVITRDGQAAGMCLRQQTETQPITQETLVIVPETVIAPLVSRPREERKALIFPQFDKTGDDGIAAADPDANTATILVAAGDYRAAIDKYRAALRRESRNTVIMLGLAQALLVESNFGIEQLAEARSLLEKAAELAPKNLQVRMLLGQVLGRMGETSRAIQTLEALTREFPKHSEAWAILADVLQHEGRKMDAVAMIQRCAELEPESLNAWNFYAEALAEVGKFDEASKARDHVSELESIYFKLKYSAPHRK